MACSKLLIVGSNVTCFVPIRCDGKGFVKIVDGTTLGFPMAPRVGNGEMLIQSRKAGAIINIRNAVHFSNNVSIVEEEEITIGDESLIGDPASVHIGKNVWLGSRVIVEKGVIIGEDSIIAANSVVSPANCIASGNPAVIVKNI